MQLLRVWFANNKHNISLKKCFLSLKIKTNLVLGMTNSCLFKNFLRNFFLRLNKNFRMFFITTYKMYNSIASYHIHNGKYVYSCTSFVIFMLFNKLFISDHQSFNSFLHSSLVSLIIPGSFSQN